MIDIDIIIQNIETKIKSLESLKFDDKPKQLLYTPITAITITSSTNFHQLECQKFVRDSQNEKIERQNPPKENQQSGGTESLQNTSKFSKSYTEFLNNLNEEMKRFKEQQKRNQSCENFLGKSAKIFTQNENFGQTCKNSSQKEDISAEKSSRSSSKSEIVQNTTEKSKIKDQSNKRRQELRKSIAKIVMRRMTIDSGLIRQGSLEQNQGIQRGSSVKIQNKAVPDKNQQLESKKLPKIFKHPTNIMKSELISQRRNSIGIGSRVENAKEPKILKISVSAAKIRNQRFSLGGNIGKFSSEMNKVEFYKPGNNSSGKDLNFENFIEISPIPKDKFKNRNELPTKSKDFSKISYNPVGSIKNTKNFEQKSLLKKNLNVKTSNQTNSIVKESNDSKLLPTSADKDSKELKTVTESNNLPKFKSFTKILESTKNLTEIIENSTTKSENHDTKSNQSTEVDSSNQSLGKRKRQINPKYKESEYMLKNTSREFTNAIRSKLTLNKVPKTGRKQSIKPDESTSMKLESSGEDNQKSTDTNDSAGGLDLTNFGELPSKTDSSANITSKTESSDDITSKTENAGFVVKSRNSKEGILKGIKLSDLENKPSSSINITSKSKNSTRKISETEISSNLKRTMSEISRTSDIKPSNSKNISSKAGSASELTEIDSKFNSNLKLKNPNNVTSNIKGTSRYLTSKIRSSINLDIKNDVGIKIKKTYEKLIPISVSPKDKISKQEGSNTFAQNIGNSSNKNLKSESYNTSDLKPIKLKDYIQKHETSPIKFNKIIENPSNSGSSGYTSLKSSNITSKIENLKNLNLKSIKLKELSQKSEASTSSTQNLNKIIDDSSKSGQFSSTSSNITPKEPKFKVLNHDFRKKMNNERFRTESHMIIHHKRIKFECGYCGEIFLKKESLNSHIKTHMLDNDKYYLNALTDHDFEEELELMEEFSEKSDDEDEISEFD